MLDYPEHVAAIVFTQGCPLRCVYCHNPELLAIGGATKNATVSTDYVLGHLQERRAFLDGVVVTGGEPTIHPDLPDFLERIKDLGLKVKLDTNGVHPRMVERVISNGLADFIAMDLKHVWGRYAELVGGATRTIIDNCQETFNLILASGLEHEFRTTVYPASHCEEDLLKITEALGPKSRYALQMINYSKTLEPNLTQTATLDLEAVARRIRLARPGLSVEVRA